MHSATFDVDLKYHNTIRSNEITTLIFEGKNLRVIAADTAQATDYKVPYGFLCADEDMDELKKVPGLTLVKDGGIYLMSGRDKSPLKKNSIGRLPVSYAKGYELSLATYGLCRHAVGGSDFAMKLELPLKWIKILAEKRCQLKVDVVQNGYGWPVPIDILKIIIVEFCSDVQ